ncbi:MAG: succinate dehydrogenase iron-sulfur subunit [Chloroflexi bacterium]|nr:succinate dehydrogenase iron-sulfur subunit [Chloroflexota bacterium]
MQAKLDVYRYDPESDDPSSRQQYSVELTQYGTVLDALLDIRDSQDGTLAFRCSCRSAICGSCSMKINGQSRLACKTLVAQIEHEGEVITVDPMGNMPTIKDLVVDMDSFWDKIRSVQPYLRPEGPEPEREYLVSNESMTHLAVAMNCIMCGACVSDCTVLEVDKSFIGPAALAKAFRFAADPRDGHRQDRLELYTEPSGIWDCTRCSMCVQACPKDVAPMDRIMELRSMAIQGGLTDSRGARHIEGFAQSVKHSGRLDEFGLARKTYGFPRWGFELAPLGITRLLRRRLPPIIHKGITTAKNITRIFEKLGV